MTRRWIMSVAVTTAMLASPAAGQKYFNAAKQKLIEGKQIFGGTVTTSDPAVYCAMAASGWDFLWIEMQHSPLSYSEVARMIFACRDSRAVPFIRVPDATEGDIQKATDAGALGIIVPMVDTVEKIQAAVKFARYPPDGRRSQGEGNYHALYGSGYRQAANDNIVIVAMIENPEGVAIADKIAAVPGVDVIFAASGDLGSFSGKRPGEPEYEAMVSRIKDAALTAGKKLGGPITWRSREGFTFFQGPSEATLIRMGSHGALNPDARGAAGAEIQRELEQKYGPGTPRR
jgi:2-keto-3-deoxy-L-rhamnonate aldolase RhmA